MRMRVAHIGEAVIGTSTISATSYSASGTVTAGTGVTATTGGVTATIGDITATDGNVVVSATDHYVISTNIKSPAGQHLIINSTDDSKQPRINSRNFAQTSGDSIGFQAKPAQNATSTGTVQGGQISPRVNDTFGLATIIGCHVDAYLKGTTGNLSGDVRVLNLELVTDDAGARNVGGYVTGIRLRTCFSAGTITGNVTALRVEKPETQTGSETFTGLFELTSSISGVWDKTAAVGATQNGYVKVFIDGEARYIPTYTGLGA